MKVHLVEIHFEGTMMTRISKGKKPGPLNERKKFDLPGTSTVFVPFMGLSHFKLFLFEYH